MKCKVSSGVNKTIALFQGERGLKKNIKKAKGVKCQVAYIMFETMVSIASPESLGRGKVLN